MSRNNTSALASYVDDVEEIIRWQGRLLFSGALDESYIDAIDDLMDWRHRRAEIIRQGHPFVRDADRIGELLDRVERRCLYMVELRRLVKGEMDDSGVVHVVTLKPPFEEKELYARKDKFLIAKGDLDQDLRRLRDLATCARAGPPIEKYVTLDQMAAVVSRSKRTLEKYKTRENNPLPAPDVDGGGGKPDEWPWARVRPWLEEEFGRTLSERFP